MHQAVSGAESDENQNKSDQFTFALAELVYLFSVLLN